MKVSSGRLLNELFRVPWWLFPLFMVLCVSWKLCTRHGCNHHVISHCNKMTEFSCQAEPCRQNGACCESCSHLFCTSGFEGIRINPPSPELISCHNWNQRAILAFKKGEKYRRKTRLYALPVLSWGLSNMKYRIMLLVSNIISCRDFLFFKKYISYASAGGQQLQ